MGNVQYTVGSVAIIIDGDGRFLCGKRRNPDGKGLWGVPGGHVKAGEHPRVTAIRETKEETGLSLAGGTLLDAYPGEGSAEEPWIVLFYVFRLRRRNIDIENLDEKNTEGWEWHPLINPPQPLFGPLAEIVEKIWREACSASE